MSEDKEARQTLETLTSLADEGNIDEAENKLYEMTCDGDRQNLEIGLLFYYALNGKDDEFLEQMISAARRFMWESRISQIATT